MEEIDVKNLNSLENKNLSKANSSEIKYNIENKEENTIEVSPLTLDEPIKVSIKREFLMIGQRIKLIFSKYNSLNDDKKLIYNYDLYLPIIIIMLLTIISSLFSEDASHITSNFSIIILTIFIGGILITFNLRLFGSKISVLQTFSYFGYSLVSYLVGDLLNLILYKFTPELVLFFIDFIFIAISIIISYRFVNISIEEGKKKLALYPIILYNLILKLVILK